MAASEILFCITMLIPLVFMGIFRQWRLFWVFFIFYICFGISEWMSVAQTGSSISQHFWIFDSEHPVKGWILVISMLVMWGSLMWHFKVHKKKE